LGLAHALLGYFGDVEVAQFCDTIGEKDVGALDVPVDDFVLVQDLETTQNLVCNFPDEGLFKSFFSSVF
jgi:hypothetical protein